MAKNESRGSRRRRENGDGSVFFRKSKGLWCAELTTEFDAQGRRKRRTIYGRTKAEVIAKMKEVEAAVTVGTYVPPSRLTVGAYLKDWLQVAAKPSLRITTFERYRGLIENHAIPTVGNAPLQALMPLQLQALYNQKLAEGLSLCAKIGETPSIPNLV
jgi:integrase